MWTIYDHPSDFPEVYVARLWEGDRATDEHIVRAELTDLRIEVQRRGATGRLPRSLADDPVILEVWL